MVRFSATAVVVGAEDVLGRCLIQLDLAIEPFRSSLELSGHRGKHCRGVVGAIGSSVMWFCNIPVGQTLGRENTGGWGKGIQCGFCRIF